MAIFGWWQILLMMLFHLFVGQTARHGNYGRVCVLCAVGTAWVARPIYHLYYLPRPAKQLNAIKLAFSFSFSGAFRMLPCQRRRRIKANDGCCCCCKKNGNLDDWRWGYNVKINICTQICTARGNSWNRKTLGAERGTWLFKKLLGYAVIVTISDSPTAPKYENGKCAAVRFGQPNFCFVNKNRNRALLYVKWCNWRWNFETATGWR